MTRFLPFPLVTAGLLVPAIALVVGLVVFRVAYTHTLNNVGLVWNLFLAWIPFGLALLLYATVVWLISAAFVRFYEEPTLARRFGADYEAYRRAVPAWWPRLRPWDPGERGEPGAR